MRRDALLEKLHGFVRSRMEADGISLWLIATRESSPDPVADALGGGTAVGRMAIGLTVDGDRLDLSAVCASYDVAPLEESGLYSRIDAYGSEGWTDALTRLIASAGDGAVAIDVSRDEPFADGLSHGLFLEIEALVPEARRRSAEGLVVELFGRKTPPEIETLRRSVVEAEAILRWALTEAPFHPGRTTEREVAERIEGRVAAAGFGFAWDRDVCPSVQFGISRGHAPPGDRTARPGDIVMVDFGVEIDGLVSDLQRTAVVESGGEVPDSVARLWRIAMDSVDAGAEAMRPGATGLSVDEASRSVIHAAGCPDFIHATGHPLGYSVHDVGPMLGPDWPGRYGARVFETLQPGMVFTLEPGAAEERDGEMVRIGIEEDVLVTESGREFLCDRQRELWRIPEGGRG